MKIIIRADRKIGKQLIAEHTFRDKRIIDRIFDFLNDISVGEIYIASDKDLKVRSATNIPLSKLDLLKNKQVVDLKFTYDARKLRKLIKKGKPLEKAIIIENKTRGNLNYLGCLYERKEWNPISKFYIEPAGEKIGYWLRKTNITPNAVSFFNIILSLIAIALLFFWGTLNLILFGLWVRIFHMIDIVDGQIARLKSQGTKFGKWVDGGGDRLVIGLWYIAIVISLYLRTQKTFFLFVGLAILFGDYMYNYLLLTSVAYFRSFKSDYKSTITVKKNPIVKFVLLFINHDIQLHALTLCAFMDKMDWFIIFYAFYFNFIWFMYFIFYLIKYLMDGDVNEV